MTQVHQASFSHLTAIVESWPEYGEGQGRPDYSFIEIAKALVPKLKR